MYKWPVKNNSIQIYLYICAYYLYRPLVSQDLTFNASCAVLEFDGTHNEVFDQRNEEL